VAPRASLDAMAKKKLLCPESNPGCSAHGLITLNTAFYVNAEVQ